MLDLKNMSDADFCVVVTPPVPRSALQVTLYETGKVTLSGKLAEQFSGKPVEIRFNKARTAMQISCLPEPSDGKPIVFPKNGRKSIPSAAEQLRAAAVALPAVFRSYDLPENGKWRGAHQENPTKKSSASSRSTKQRS